MAQNTTGSELPTSNPDQPTPSTSRSKRKQGAEGVERKRVSQACDQCRSKKLKCDGGKPACNSCVSFGRQCQYGSIVKKRGLPEGYVRGLEKLLGLMIAKDRQADGNVSRMFSDALADGNKRAELMAAWNGGEDGDTLPEIWRSSQLSKALEQLLPDLESADGRMHEFKKPRLEPHSVNYGRRNSTSSNHADGLPRQDDAEDLFDIYFTYTDCWLPIIGRDETYALYYRTLELSESSLESGENAKLWAILAYAEVQRAAMSQGLSEITQSPTGKAYYEKARGLIPSEGQDFEIGHVQAFLILSLLNLELGQLSTAWLLVGQAVNVAIDIGLGKMLTLYEMENPSKSSGTRKNVFLGCFCLDTLIAARLERCPRLIKEDAQLVGQLDENGLAEWGHWRSRNSREQRSGPSRSVSTFNQFVRLNYVLNDSIRETYLGVADDEAFDNAHNRLYVWKKQLPPHCWLRTSSEPGFYNEAILPHQLNLNLMFIISMTVLALRCTGAYESLDNTMRKYPDHSQLPLQIMEQIRSFQTTFGTAAFPSTIQVLRGVLTELKKRSARNPGSAEYNQSLVQLSAQMRCLWPSEEDKTLARESTRNSFDPLEVSGTNNTTTAPHNAIPHQSGYAAAQSSSHTSQSTDSKTASIPPRTTDVASEDPSTYSAAGDLFYFAQVSRASQLPGGRSVTSQSPPVPHIGSDGVNPGNGHTGP